MTVQEYIEKDLPFYHITPIENKESILQTGLNSRKNKQGICVVRSSDKNVWNEIASLQLSYNEGKEYSHFVVIKIQPSKHNIKWTDIGPDSTEEKTNHLHNYIHVSKIIVTEDDIVDDIKLSVSNFDYKVPQDTLEGYNELYLKNINFLSSLEL